MEAKDTVISPKGLRAIRDRIRKSDPNLSADREAEIALATAYEQHKISFKAGEQQGIPKGRKEVVEWLKQHPSMTLVLEQFPGFKEEWQAKLKEWEVK